MKRPAQPDRYGYAETLPVYFNQALLFLCPKGARSLRLPRLGLA
jgi:hypothetical protein